MDFKAVIEIMTLVVVLPFHAALNICKNIHRKISFDFQKW